MHRSQGIESRPRMVRTTTTLTGALLLACSLAACRSSSSGTEAVVATAGSHNITAGLFAAYVQQVAHGPPEKLDPTYRARLLQELVQITSAAEAEAQLADRETGYAVELQRLNLLANAGAKRAGVFAEPSEATIQQAYAAFVNSHPAAEYRVAHVLVPTEAAALGVIRKLTNGADFATLAKTESADESRTRGGEIGWVHPGALPKTFTEAAVALAPGQYTTQPVKSPYGWHVIRLLERRTSSAPPLAEVRAQLVANLQHEKYEAFLAKAK